MGEKSLSPFVYWGQTTKEIFLKIELSNVDESKMNVDVQDHTVVFEGEGVGSRGLNNYSFKLDLMFAVDPNETKVKATGRNVEIKLIKQEVKLWDRLLHENLKLAWLKSDFNNYTHEEDLSDEVRDIHQDYPGMFEAMKAQETAGLVTKEMLRKFYLCTYNMFMWICFFYIVVVIVLRFIYEGYDSFAGNYAAVCWMVRLAFITQFLEILHTLVGFTKGSMFETTVQVCGRAMVFFCMIEMEERMQPKPVVSILFLVWSLIEVVRYPFYLLRVYDKQYSLVTWLRYTIWIPLYPAGFILEGIVILRSIPYVDETKRLMLAMPNALNWTFNFATVMRMYLLFFFFPAMFKMMSYMYYQRIKKLSRKVKKN